MRGIALVPLEVNEPSTTKIRLRVVLNIATTSVGVLRILHQSREELSGASGRLKFCNIVQAVSGGWHRDQVDGTGITVRRLRAVCVPGPVPSICRFLHAVLGQD